MFTALLIIIFDSFLALPHGNSNSFNNFTFLDEHYFSSFSDSSLVHALQAYQEAKIRRDQKSLGDAAFELGMIYYTQEQYTQAMECFEEVKAVAKQLSDAALAAKALDKMAAIHRKKDRLVEALPLQKIGLEYAYASQQSQLIIDILRNLGYTYWLLQEYDSALYYYQERIPLCTKLENIQYLIEAHTDVANLLYNLNRFETCIPYFESAINFIIQTEDTRQLANIYNYLAHAYRIIGAHQKAYYALLTALPLLQEAKNHDELASAYSTLGTLSLQLMNIKTAIRFFEHSLHLRDSINDGEGTVLSLLNLGIAYHQYKDYNQAKEYLFDAEKKCNNNELKELKAYAHDNLGKVYLALQQSDSALYHYHKALHIRQKFVHPSLPNLADVHTELANTYLLLGDYKQVEHHLQESTRALGLLVDNQSLSIYEIPKSNHPISGEEYLDLMRLKGDYFGIAFTDTAAWEAGLKHYETGIRFLLNAFVFAPDLEQSKLAWLTLYRPMFESAIELAQRLYATTHHMAYLERAFALVEQNKALLLRQSLQESQAKASANIPDSLMVYEQALRGDIFQKETELLKAEQAKDSTQIWQVRTELTQLRERYFQWMENMVAVYPEYYTLKYDINTVSIQKIQQQLAPRTSLINYFLGEEYLFSFGITKDTILSHQFVLPDDWNTHLQSFYQALTNYNYLLSNDQEVRQIIAEQGHFFYKMLVAPFLEKTQKDVEKLIVVPDGMLNLLPFSVLLTDPPQTLYYSEFPYLLKKLSVQYTYSANLYFQPIAPALLVAPHYTFGGFTADYSIKDPKDTTEYALVPKTQQLTNQAAAMMGGKAWENATKEIFLTYAPQCRIVHFGGHAIAGNANLSDNRLVFHANPPKDRYLYLPEIYNLDLRGTDLVVLSGCNTGIGAIESGEGIISTARAFMYAGSQDILLALNIISDAPTRELFQSFYENLDSGLSIEESLRQAKLAYLTKHHDDLFLSHPIYWASIITFGRSGEMKLDSLQHANDILSVTVVIIMLIAGCFLVWFFREKALVKKVLQLILGYAR